MYTTVHYDAASAASCCYLGEVRVSARRETSGSLGACARPIRLPCAGRPPSDGRRHGRGELADGEFVDAVDAPGRGEPADRGERVGIASHHLEVVAAERVDLLVLSSLQDRRAAPGQM